MDARVSTRGGIAVSKILSPKELKRMQKQKLLFLSTEFVLLLLGGKWPNYKECGFEEVDCWKLIGNQLVPCDFAGDEIPLPNLMLSVNDDVHQISGVKRKILTPRSSYEEILYLNDGINSRPVFPITHK